ncbi:hypothetical protein H2203_001169 [Taxawa tesnikishii (nom. ined.)]|nr:hypothetical protein H2203_001169 [Dothideales sp. JES 119]
MGNGAKAQQKRERNAKDAKGAAKSQLKDNAAAMNKKCVKCFQAFLSTTNKKALDEHAQSKHSLSGKDCFGDAYDQCIEVNGMNTLAPEHMEYWILFIH